MEASRSSSRNFLLRAWLAVFAAAATLGGTGCQVDVGGQTIPSAYYLTDDVQYFAPGPEFKLANEAAALKAQRQEARRQSLP